MEHEATGGILWHWFCNGCIPQKEFEVLVVVIKDRIQSNNRTSNSRMLSTVKTQNRIQNKLFLLCLRFRPRIANLLLAYSS